MNLLRTNKKTFFCIIALFFMTALFYAEDTINKETGFPNIQKKPFIMFNEGFSVARSTRIIDQEKNNRSNFVYNTDLVGAYFGFKTGNMQPFNSLLKLTAYYPYYHAFNGVEQKPKQLLLWGADLFYGWLYEADMWKYVRISLSPGLHFSYELSDDAHVISLGAGILTGLELPLAEHWTILLDGLASFDYANFGSNARMSPYDWAFEYQFSFGFRYSVKGANEYSYITSKKKIEDIKFISTPKEMKKDDKEKISKK